MFTSIITDPHGKTWHVSLRLIPARKGIGLRERFLRRHKNKNETEKDHWYDFLDLPFDFDSITLLLIWIAAAIFFVFVGWPLLLLLADLIWFLLVVLGAVISFGIFRRQVTILASSGDNNYTWKARGFMAAQKRKKEIVHDLAAGVLPINNVLKR